MNILFVLFFKVTLLKCCGKYFIELLNDLCGTTGKQLPQGISIFKNRHYITCIEHVGRKSTTEISSSMRPQRNNNKKTIPFFSEINKKIYVLKNYLNFIFILNTLGQIRSLKISIRRRAIIFDPFIIFYNFLLIENL